MHLYREATETQIAQKEFQHVESQSVKPVTDVVFPQWLIIQT